MKHGIIRKKGFWTVFILFIGLLVLLGFTQESKIPWAVDGYQKVSEFHLKYWSLTKETFEDFQNIKEGNTKSELSELWFSQNPPLRESASISMWKRALYNATSSKEENGKKQSMTEKHTSSKSVSFRWIQRERSITYKTSARVEGWNCANTRKRKPLQTALLL